MIAGVFKGKNSIGQTVWLLLLLAGFLPYVYFKGMKFEQPEDSSALYSHFIFAISQFPLWLKLLSFYILNGWILFQINILWKSLSPGRSYKAAPTIVGAIYILLISECCCFHPVLFAVSLFVPGFIELIRASVLPNSKLHIFNAGLYISVASLLYYPMLLFIPFSLASLFTLRLYNWRYFGALIIGVAIPWLYYFIYIWLGLGTIDSSYHSILGIYASNFFFFRSYLAASMGVWHYFIIITVVFIFPFSLLHSINHIDHHVIVIRQSYKTLYWVVVPIVLIMLFSGGLFFYSLLFLSVVIVPLFTDFMFQIGRVRVADLVLWGAMALAATSQIINLI